MIGYYDRNGVELNAGDYIRVGDHEEPQMLYEWSDGCGNRGLGTDATNPAWIRLGRAVACEYGVYDLDCEDMKHCELVSGKGVVK